MKHVGTALAGAVAVAFTQLAIAQGTSSEGSYALQPDPAYGAQQGQQYEPRTQQNYRHDSQPEQQYDSGASSGAMREDRDDNHAPGDARDRDADRRPDTVRGDDDPPRNDWRYPGKPEGDD